MLAARPAAGPAHAFLQLFLSPANASFPRLVLFRVLDPADELVAGEWRDVVPHIESRRVGDQRLTQVGRKLVYHPAPHLPTAHQPKVAALLAL